MTSKERREEARKRTQKDIDSNDKGGGFGKQYLTLSGLENVKWFKPTKGTNEIDIIPYIVASKHHPKRLEPGEEDYNLDIWVHRFIGANDDAFICLKKTFGKSCPICEEMATLRSNGAEESEYAPLKPSRRAVYNVIDLNGEDDSILLWDVSYVLFQVELLDELQALSNKDEYIYPFDIEIGKTITFRASEATLGTNKFFKYKSFKFEDRDAYPEGIYEKTYALDNLIVVPSEDEIKQSLFEIDLEEEEEEEAIPEPEPAKETRTRRQPEPETPPIKPRKRRTAPAEPEEEEEVSNPCPQGFTFGVDNDKQAKCVKCPQETWDACADAAAKLKG